MGTNGRVAVDYAQGIASLWRGRVGEVPPPTGARQPDPETRRLPAGFERNQLFREELRYFLDCIHQGRTPAPGIAEAAESVRIALTPPA